MIYTIFATMIKILRRYSLVIALLAVSLWTSAKTPGVSVFRNPVEMLKYHLRLRPDMKRDAVCELIWNLRDDSCRVLRFVVPPIVSNDEMTGFESSWTLVDRKCGHDSILDTGTFRSRYAGGDGVGFSAVLNADGSGGTVCLGGDAVAETVAVGFDNMVPGGIGYWCSDSLGEIKNRIWFRSLPAPERSRFADKAAIKEYLSGSTDPCEGIWEFMDRENDPSKAVPGSAYVLATVSDGKGGYEIVNMSDPGMFLKGRMKATRFASNYDLTWRDRSGRDVGPECYAVFEIQNLTLRLYFPLLGASMRFRRID